MGQPAALAFKAKTMINFFRRIRKDLMEKNKTWKYLKYAIGEILLIVMGILIAVQINNWNENRKLRNLEYKFLVQINEDLKASSISLEKSISYNKKSLIELEKILSHIKKDLAYSNALDSSFVYIFYWSDPMLIYTAYETIKSKGFDVIQNDSIRNAIIETFEVSFPFLINELRAEWEIFQSLVLPFAAQNIHHITSDTARPTNFENLKNNDYFQNFVSIKMRTRENISKQAELAKAKVDSLIKLIERELKKGPI